jgi:hypothetical protein
LFKIKLRKPCILNLFLNNYVWKTRILSSVFTPCFTKTVAKYKQNINSLSEKHIIKTHMIVFIKWPSKYPRNFDDTNYRPIMIRCFITWCFRRFLIGFLDRYFRILWRLDTPCDSWREKNHELLDTTFALFTDDI